MASSLGYLLITAGLAGGLTAQQTDPADTPSADEPAISWKQVPSDILHAQKQIWLFPTEVARGRHIPSTLLFLGSSAALVAADPSAARYFRDNSSTYHGLNHRLSGTTTTAAELAIP